MPSLSQHAHCQYPGWTRWVLLLGLIALIALIQACAGPTPTADEEGEAPAAEVEWVPDPEATERYISKVESAQSDHESVDYGLMRELFVQTLFYQPYAGAEQQFSEAMFESLERNQDRDALRLAGRILEENYTSLDAHYVARTVYAQRGDQRRRDRHDHILRALFESIRNSGDGDSRGSAFQVISTRELQTFISLYGLTLVDSDLEADELGTHDRVLVRDPDTDEEFELWFDISHQWRRGFDGF